MNHNIKLIDGTMRCERCRKPSVVIAAENTPCDGKPTEEERVWETIRLAALS